MPDLGRETGKFIRNEESAPKDVRTFEPAKEPSKEKNAGKLLSFALPLRPTTIA
jgi:hypothetical protein